VLQGILTTAQRFKATFASDLEVEQKCLLLGAIFLIHFVDFERNLYS
jgi:hypothetical protein